MTFHTTPQFHTTISHHTLFFTTPFCTTSHSVVHPGLRHSTSYNIPFHITPYNKYISSVVPFNSALNAHFSPLDFDYFVCVREVVCHWFRACVCSGHIPHHECRSVYVINRVQITFRITLLHTTLNVFTPRIIPSHNAKRFYIPLSHTTPFHITLPLHNIPHHFSAYYMFHVLRRLMSQHISPRTTIFNIWHHITPQSASHRHFTPPHHTGTVHISHHSTSTSIPHHTLNIAAHFTPHHIPHHITPPHHDFTSQWHLTTHCIIFHIRHHTTTTQHTLHMATFFITIPHHHGGNSHRNFPHLALCNIPHTRTPHSMPHHIPHHTFCISVTFHIVQYLKFQHFTYTSHHISRRTIIHLKSLHHM